jgi:uncharacterized protein (DUF433 family)
MATMETAVEIDWMACELIEAVPGKVSGRPVVRGTRIMPDAILNSYELGDSVEEIHEGFPTLSIAQIKRLIEFGLDQLKQRHP